MFWTDDNEAVVEAPPGKKSWPFFILCFQKLLPMENKSKLSHDPNDGQKQDGVKKTGDSLMFL